MYIQKLIQEYCPNGVEYKTLGEVCKIEKGEQLNKEVLLKEGQFPVINGGINPSGFWNEYNYEKNLITISQGGASAGYVNYITTNFWAGAHCYVLTTPKEYINYKLLYYIVKNYEKELQSSQVGAGIPSVSSNKLASLKIPIPPIEVQREIVRILDKLTELIDSLKIELALRNKQYEYYRETLYKDIALLKYIKLKELCQIGDGLHGTPKYDENGKIYFVNGNNLKNGNIIIDDNTKKISNDEFCKLEIPFNQNTILLSINGTIGKVALYNNEKITLGKSVAYFNINSNQIIRKYLYYYLLTTISQEYFIKNATGGTIKNLGLKTLREYTVPVPPLREQARIVAILDKFDALCNDLTQGLPAEIELRKKQYEYYRDKLLKFENVSS